MASKVREFALSAVRQLRQPRWNRLLLKSNINLHLPVIHQQRRFSKCPDEGDEDQKKFCIDYKKNPTIEGHEPPDLPNLQPADPKLRIAKRREFLKKKQCEELGKQMDKEKAEEDEPCDNFSRVRLMWGKPKVRTSLVLHKINSCLAQLSKQRPLDPDLGYLSQERAFCRKVKQEQASSAKSQPSGIKKNYQKRMALKRQHFQDKKKKEADAKTQALAKLMHASSSNVQTNKDLKITQSNSGQAEPKQNATPLVYAKPQDEASNDQGELKDLLKIIKERCRKKCEEFEKSLEAESKREAEEAAQRNQEKMAHIGKLCKEAKVLNSVKMDKLKKMCEEARLRKQFDETKLGNPTK